MKTFFGGTHPKENKRTAHLPIKDSKPVTKVVIPLSQHAGMPAEAVVNVGDEVKAGSLIAKARGFISANIHASVSGKVSSISEFAHPTLAKSCAITIDADQNQAKSQDISDKIVKRDLSAQEIRDIILKCGIVGMGGAGFPTHVKLTVPEGKKIDFVILNGSECEPYLTCDHRLMLERNREILEGLKLVMKACGAKKAFVAIEDNKTDAIDLTKSSLKDKSLKEQFDISVVPLRSRYPQGAEKQLISVVTDREVPSGGLPFDVGVLAQNVATAFGIYEAAYFNKPLYERVITVSGSCIKEPVNLRVKVGTLVKDIIDMCGGLSEEPRAIVFGGPMMGIAQYTKDVPVTKGTSGILFLGDCDLEAPQDMPCIRCGKCVELCPMKLHPTTIASAVKKERFDISKEFDCLDCIECGTCSFVCPSKINLVHYIKYGKLKARQ